MFSVSFNNEFQELKEFYACAKCKSQEITIPVLLKTCRHIFCTRCLVIHGRQKCPALACKTPYTPNDVDRGNKFVTNVLEMIKKLEGEFPVSEYSMADIAIPALTQETDEIPCDSPEIDTNLQPVVRLEKLDTNASNENEFETNEFVFENVSLAKDTVHIKRNAKGETPLHLACKKGDAITLKKLVTSSTDVNIVDWSNCTPLHDAVQKGSFACVRLLLEAGCLPSVPAHNYTTPLHLACDLRHIDIAMELVRHGADIKAIEQNGNTVRDCLKSLGDDNETEATWRKMMDISEIYQTLDGAARKPRFVFQCDSSKCAPKMFLDASVLSVKVTDGREYMLFKDTLGLHTPQVMAALVKAIPVISEQDVAKFLQCTNLPSMIALIPPSIRATYKKSLMNRLYNQPKLFNGFNIHVLPPHDKQTQQYSGTLCRREDLHALIDHAGGCILKRAPTESTTSGRLAAAPYHCRQMAPDDKFRACAHYIVYDKAAPPKLMYNMKELRHVSAQWLINCLTTFEIKSD